MKWFRRRKPNRLKSAEQPVRWRARLTRAFAALAAVATAAFAADYLRETDWERFRALEITGELERVSAAEVRAALQPHIEKGFAGIDMRAARESVEALPWVADAAVRRQWPGVLVVELREQRPVATWFGTALMNAHGEVFIDGAAGLSGVLPDVGGPAGSQQVMIQRLEELRAAVSASELELRRLLRTERRAERFWLANGVEVRLGRRDAELRLNRFLNVAWPVLRTRAGEVAYVDMRYTNGFAVGWKKAKSNGNSMPGAGANVQEI